HRRRRRALAHRLWTGRRSSAFTPSASGPPRALPQGRRVTGRLGRGAARRGAAHWTSLGGRKTLSLTELADEDYVLWTRALAAERHDALHRAFNRAGFARRVVLDTGDPLSALSLVRVGLSISVFAHEYRQLGRADVTFVPLRSTATITYA